MRNFICEFRVNGIRTEMEIYCNSSVNAKKIIELMFRGCDISFISVR